MKILIPVLLTITLSSKALAHFQMLYTPDTALNKGKVVEIRQVFTHPFEDKYTLDMGKQHDTKELTMVESFYVINKKKKNDLTSKLKAIQFQGNNNAGHAYAMKYKARKMGDHVLVLKAAPFYEQNQDIYIQQIVKTIINVAGAPTNWSDDLQLEAEIVPLVKPYAIWEGSNFTGIVKAQGEIVPFAQVDITYLNRDIDIKNNRMGKDKIKAPHNAFITLSIKANKEGEFTFTIPKAGFWGFCAQDLNSEKTYKGKKLKQDALIWVEAKKMKEL